jgi:hypothetical protein
MTTTPRAVADAVLYEGFLLFPYTASALKNRSRWQFGVLMPHGYADTSEPTWMETHVLAQAAPDAQATVEIVARFLQVTDAAVEREVAMHADLREGECHLPFRFNDLHGTLAVAISRDGDYLRLTVRVHNKSRVAPTAGRNEALRKALVSAHALLTISGGAFISLLDPPEAAKLAASRCKNRHVYPVLAGEPGEGQTAQTVLASPIILYDFPAIAAQSPGQTFDGTEIDELLMLSVASMTDEEKREARETDERAKAIVDRAEAMTAPVQQSLHGRIQVGARVRVHPKRRADAFDMFAEGQTALVKGLVDDVDGRSYVSVVFEADPASDLHEWYGRSFFYERHEVEPLGDDR